LSVDLVVAHANRWIYRGLKHRSEIDAQQVPENEIGEIEENSFPDVRGEKTEVDDESHRTMA